MVRFVEHLPPETIVLVRAIVQEPHAHGQTEIKYTSIHNVEVRIQTVRVWKGCSARKISPFLI